MGDGEMLGMMWYVQGVDNLGDFVPPGAPSEIKREGVMERASERDRREQAERATHRGRARREKAERVTHAERERRDEKGKLRDRENERERTRA